MILHLDTQVRNKPKLRQNIEKDISFQLSFRPYQGMDEDEQFQNILKTTIDILGYNKRSIANRRDFVNVQNQTLTQLLEPDISCHIVGSKAEGMTLQQENDFDIMYVLNDVVCEEKNQGNSNCTVVFEIATEKYFPGYCKLKLKKTGNDIPFDLEPLFQDDTGATCISSDFFINSIQNNLKQGYYYGNIVCLSRAGPSCPHLFHTLEGSFSCDTVYCFRCKCPTLLRRWSHRKRYQKWPTQDMIAHVKTLDAHVVPVGVKGHMQQFAQWRICFTLGEIYLVNTLNENMLQMYAILKNLISGVIKPVCKEITSYIAKNIVLWIAETLPTDNLDLVPLLLKAILLLKMAVNDEYLPSYMIPERNLLLNRLSLQEKMQLEILLSEMLEEKGAMVLRSPRLGREMCFVYSRPERLDERRKIYETFTTYPAVFNDTISKLKLNYILDKLSANEELSSMDLEVSSMDFYAKNPKALRELLHQCPEYMNSINQFAEHSSLQEFICDSEDNNTEDVNNVESYMRLPVQSYFKLMNDCFGMQLDSLDIPPGVTFRDVLSEEELTQCINESISENESTPDFSSMSQGFLRFISENVGTDTDNGKVVEWLLTEVQNPAFKSTLGHYLCVSPLGRFLKGQ